MAREQDDEQKRKIWPAFVAAAATVTVLAFAAAAILIGVRNLTIRNVAVSRSPRNAASSLWQLVILAAAAGLLSFAIVEFSKRLFFMSRLFNIYAARSAFGSALEFQAQPEFGTSKPIAYSGTIRQVAAQISVQLRQLVDLSANQAVPEARRRLALALALGTDGPFSGELPRQGDSTPTQLETIQDLVDRRLDIFQIETTQRWRTLLRSLAAITAGLLSAMSAWAVAVSASAIIVASIVGVIVGGPVAWITRDLTRIVERKAQF